ncbi:MAG: hypothetical protein GXY19_03405 [Phycisphaerae bacterium]|nr:hypothetical protein [Phycisphaerae bacterium]
MLTGECHTLLDICGPDIYSRNAFRLLAVDVDATGRKIKRNEAELQSALEVGELAEEYGEFLRPDPLPSREELLQAGRVLADARQRFVHEFFWFWPLQWGQSHADEALKCIQANQVSEAQRQWEDLAGGDGEAAWAARHNLAILGHWKALDQEREILTSINLGGLSEQTRRQFDSHWDFAFRYWESLCANEEFWSLLADRIGALNDPRLTVGFLRDFSQWLPIAFDNINADLAVAYCDHQMYDRARDHIRIMKATNAGHDDVDASLRRVTRPLNSRIDHAIETATYQLHNNKTAGKQRCIELFNTVGHILDVLEVLLGSESQEFTETCDRVAESMLQCQVAYGNETRDWASSLELLDTTLQIARGSRMRARLQENICIVRQNQGELCWFCESCPKENEHAVPVTLHRSVTWAGIKSNPAPYREAVFQIAEHLISQFSGGATGQMDVVGMILAKQLRGVVNSGDIHATVRAVDPFVNDSVEVGSQQVTALVPRCHTCAAVHAGSAAGGLGERMKTGNTKPLDHLQSWPGIVKAKQDGFHIVA